MPITIALVIGPAPLASQSRQAHASLNNIGT